MAILILVAVLSPALPGADLPADREWKRVLREFLGGWSEEDFLIGNHEFTFPDSYAGRDDERVFRDWIVLGNAGREPPVAGFRATPVFFLRKTIEGGERIRCFPEPAALAWWIQFDFPGNPYAGSETGRRRALVIAIVDMLMLETAHEVPYTIKPDFMGANLGTWAYTYRVCGDQLSREARDAYREGMRHYLELMERIAPRDGNSNMDMRELATLAELSHVFGEDAAMRARLAGLAKRILFGSPDRGPSTSDPRRGTFHPAGYIGEADGPETSYNGISMFHLAEAAMVSRGDPAWDAFLPEVIERMARFRAYNTFPQPDGRFEGPSSWSTRTNDPYVRDQRDRPWRRYAEAMLTEESLHRLAGERGIPDRETMLADMRRTIDRWNRRMRQPEKWKADEAPAWEEKHWPADLPYTWDHPVSGSYARFRKALAEGDEMLLPPFAREGDFSLGFDEEFWMAKKGGWGFQVEAVPHGSRSYDKGGSGALAGGSLAAFWTKEAGVILLGRLPDKWNKVTWDSIENWPTHHLWGRTESGSAFSSARQWHPWTRFEIEKVDDPEVHVFGSLGPRRTVEVEDSIEAGHVYYRRVFAMRDEGLRVSSELLSRGTDPITELWETLPIFLASGRSKGAGETELQFRAGGRWREPGAKAVEGVETIRASRFGGAVEIVFDDPQRVRIGEAFTTAYQAKDRFRIVKIDLLGSGGRAVSMPVKAKVSYVIRPAGR